MALNEEPGAIFVDSEFEPFIKLEEAQLVIIKALMDINIEE